MGNEFQEALDHDNLVEARNNLNDFTGKINKRRYIREIEEVDNQRLDEILLSFHGANPNLTFEEVLLVKKVFDYMKRGE